jgi:hypothetical protein
MAHLAAGDDGNNPWSATRPLDVDPRDARMRVV